MEEEVFSLLALKAKPRNTEEFSEEPTPLPIFPLSYRAGIAWCVWANGNVLKRLGLRKGGCMSHDQKAQKICHVQKSEISSVVTHIRSGHVIFECIPSSIFLIRSSTPLAFSRVGKSLLRKITSRIRRIANKSFCKNQNSSICELATRDNEIELR